MDMAENRSEDIFTHAPPYEKKYFFCTSKKLPAGN